MFSLGHAAAFRVVMMVATEVPPSARMVSIVSSTPSTLKAVISPRSFGVETSCTAMSMVTARACIVMLAKVAA